MLVKMARRIENDILKAVSAEESAELISIIKSQINTIILQESQIDNLDANLMLNKGYTECLLHSLNSNNTSSSLDGTETLCRVLFQLGLIDVNEFNGYGVYNPTDCLKYFIIDNLTGGEYLRQLIRGLLYYNSLGVTLHIDYSTDVLCGRRSGNQEITVEIVKSGDICCIKFIKFSNFLIGNETLEDILTLLTDSLCILDAPTGLRFFRDAYFAGKRDIVYTDTRSIPIIYKFYSTDKDTEYYNSVHGELMVQDRTGQYISIPRYCSNIQGLEGLKQTNNHSNIVVRSTEMQGFFLGSHSNGVIMNPNKTITLAQNII